MWSGWAARIKSAPAPYWIAGLGAGALAVDYLVEGDHSIASSIFRSIFGSRREHAEPMPPGAPPGAPPHVLPSGVPTHFLPPSPPSWLQAPWYPPQGFESYAPPAYYPREYFPRVLPRAYYPAHVAHHRMAFLQGAPHRAVGGLSHHPMFGGRSHAAGDFGEE